MEKSIWNPDTTTINYMVTNTYQSKKEVAGWRAQEEMPVCSANKNHLVIVMHLESMKILYIDIPKTILYQ